MVKLPREPDTTARAIHKMYERERKDWRRPHLGASVIGHECNRFCWYTFRWATNPRFPGRMLRLFERGQREEDWILEDMRAVGIRTSGEQASFSRFGGHFSGSCDGILEGIPEDPSNRILFECKTANYSSWAKVAKHGVQKAMPKHWAQMHVYMHELELEKALYVCVNKDNDHIYTELVELDPLFAKTRLTKARLVVAYPEPLERISEDPDNMNCMLCVHRDHCHQLVTDRLERNCRTCLSSTPMPDGTWRCDYHKEELSLDDQKLGCSQHLFIPAMIGTPVDAGKDGERWVRYEDGRIDFMCQIGEYAEEEGNRR